jgi:POT family proton-dependent oligopeptide transporter
MSIGNDGEQLTQQTIPPKDLTDHAPPTDQELHDLVHVADNIPIEAWLVMLVGSAERFVFYGASTCLQNYLQYNKRDVIPGVLGLGQADATAINYAFMVLVNFAPVPLAIIADGYLGRYKLIVISTLCELLQSATRIVSPC